MLNLTKETPDFMKGVGVQLGKLFLGEFALPCRVDVIQASYKVGKTPFVYGADARYDNLIHN